MTSSQNSGLDPQLVARLSSRFDSLGDHMRQVAVDLHTLQSQLGTAPTSVPVSAPARPQPVPRSSAPTVPPQTFSPPQMPAPQQPYAARGPVSAPPVTPPPAVGRSMAAPPLRGPVVAPRPPVPPREPWWQRDGVISRLLAVAGAGVTLVGVVMLLVLAAQAGWFGPPLRVAAGGVFSLALMVPACECSVAPEDASAELLWPLRVLRVCTSTFWRRPSCTAGSIR
ncbi:hypothetical protein [Rhodococcus sp. 05-2255-1e]|uniref:hypothetical protein n=1 Tax=Rhodococcus sp. 05-2255-1e TaxID=2022495 RepID=UPI00268D6F50|nr:hypothetical protein [Rhodococcus sp. 05-2255-1e]